MWRALALGLPSRFPKGADAARRMANADPVRRARRPLAAGLSPAMVSVRERREHRPRFVAGLQKRGLPRAAMSDNGSAMTATEITEGLARLGILHQTTLPYSPYRTASRRLSGDRSKAG